MAHVVIRPHPGGRGHQLLVDDVDLSHVVAVNGVHIEPAAHYLDHAMPTSFKVTLDIFADRLDVNLPSSIVIAEPIDV